MNQNIVRHTICKPSVKSYLHHAHPLCLLETDERSKDYLVNNFLHIYSKTNTTSDGRVELLIDFYSYDGPYPRYPYVSTSWLPQDLLSCFGGNIVEQLCCLMETGYVVEVTIDEYYVSQKHAFGKISLPHPNLLYGFDRDRRVFFSQGFDANWLFRPIDIPFDEIRAGFGLNMGVLAMKLSGSPEYANAVRFSGALVRTALQGYLSGAACYPWHSPEGAEFGRSVYGKAISTLKSRRPENVDIRPWCVFHEHKQRLSILYRYLCERGHVTHDDKLATALSELVKKTLGIRDLVVMSKMASRSVDSAVLTARVDAMLVFELDVIAEILGLLANL